MPPDGDDAGREPVEPTALRHVGPATAAAIERAPFDAADVRDGCVSVRLLVEAGVNHGVAERLRREYGLRWAYRWHPGDGDLARRAANIRGAGEAERRWIAASGEGWDRRLPAAGDAHGRGDGDGTGAGVSPPDLDDLEWPAWPDPPGEDESRAGLAAVLGRQEPEPTCPRCDADLTRYALGERESVLCDACGYAGVAVDHVDGDAWRKAVDRLLRGRTTSRRE